MPLFNIFYRKADWNSINEETARKVKEEALKKQLYAKSNKERLDDVEEKVRRYMTITDSVVLDETVEEEVQLPELTPEMHVCIIKVLFYFFKYFVVCSYYGNYIDCFRLLNLY